MDFPIVELLDEDLSKAWLEKYFHPQGLCCPRCAASRQQAYHFRQTRCSRTEVYRCRDCGQTYTLYSGTLFAGRQLRPSQIVLLLRGVVQGQSSAQIARELHLSRTTVHEIRTHLHQSAQRMQPQLPLADLWSETDEMFQNAGEKRNPSSRPARPTSTPGQQATGTRHLRQ